MNARQYGCEVYADPDAATRVLEPLEALPRDRGYFYTVTHDPRCPCAPKGLQRAPLLDCKCGTILLQVTERLGVDRWTLRTDDESVHFTDRRTDDDPQT